MAKTKKIAKTAAPANQSYEHVLAEVVGLLEQARRASARSVNAVMTATYWAVGQRIVNEEQRGRRRAGYGEALLDDLARDLTAKYGRGFRRRNLFQIRAFYLAYSKGPVSGTPSSNGENGQIVQTVSALFDAVAEEPLPRFPLSWSHYVRLLSLKSEYARDFYETEALRGGWSFRQLDRQINSMFYERTALSRNKVAMLTKGAIPKREDSTTPEEEIKDPYVLEFLGLKDEYSETELEAALIAKLEAFLLELGADFAFIGRQRRLRIDDVWYRIDLLFFHRRLRCLVVIDLKVGNLPHADTGQMHLYLNFARANWTLPEENPPVGLILCAQKGAGVARYALEGLPNKVLAAEYRTTLPDEKTLVEELERSRKLLTERGRNSEPPTHQEPQELSPRRKAKSYFPGVVRGRANFRRSPDATRRSGASTPLLHTERRRCRPPSRHAGLSNRTAKRANFPTPIPLHSGDTCSGIR